MSIEQAAEIIELLWAIMVMVSIHAGLALRAALTRTT